MRATGPAAGAPDAFLQLGADPFDMLAPGLVFLDGDGPANPLVAGERGYVFPSRACLGVGSERFAEIGRELMHDSSGDLNGCHRFSLRRFVTAERATVCRFLTGRRCRKADRQGRREQMAETKLEFWDRHSG